MRGLSRCLWNERRSIPIRQVIMAEYNSHVWPENESERGVKMLFEEEELSLIYKKGILNIVIGLEENN